MRSGRFLCFISLLPLLASASLAAAPPSAVLPSTAASRPALRSAVDLERGQSLRVEVGDGAHSALIEGAFVGWRGDTLRVAVSAYRDRGAGMTAGLPISIPPGDVLAVWKRERHTGRGLRYGAAGGAVGGTVLFAVGALILRQIGDSEDKANVGTAALVGGLLGAAGGGLAGTVVGAAISRWQPVPLTGDGLPPPVHLEAAARPHIAGSARGVVGSLGLAGGFAWSEEADASSAGPGGTLGLLAEFPCGIALGPEIGWFDAGPGPRPSFLPLPGDNGLPLHVVDETVWFGGGVLRYAPPWSVRPYVALGLAGYAWEDGFLGASIGAGITTDLPRSSIAVELHYRRHENVQNLVGVDPGFSTLTVGVRWSW